MANDTIPEAIQRQFDTTGSNRRLGFRLEAAGSGRARVALDVESDHLQETGVVHGGIVAALADSASVYTFFPDLEPGRSLTSIEFKLNFLRPAVLGGGPLIAEARVVRQGRQVGLCDVDVLQDGQGIAKGLFTYLFLDTPIVPDQRGS